MWPITIFLRSSSKALPSALYSCSSVKSVVNLSFSASQIQFQLAPLRRLCLCGYSPPDWLQATHADSPEVVPETMSIEVAIVLSSDTLPIEAVDRTGYLRSLSPPFVTSHQS